MTRFIRAVIDHRNEPRANMNGLRRAAYVCEPADHERQRAPAACCSSISLSPHLVSCTSASLRRSPLRTPSSPPTRARPRADFARGAAGEAAGGRAAGQADRGGDVLWSSGRGPHHRRRPRLPQPLH
eukprot:8936455-Pyramimonas_sp.AAC.1